MKLFIETSLSDFYISLIDKNYCEIDCIFIANLVKKTDAFFENLNYLLNKNNFKLSSISEIYTTLGPGSFSGARIGLVFAKTVAQLSNIKLFVAPTYSLFYTQKKLQHEDCNLINIKANKYNVYSIIVDPFECHMQENLGNFDLFNKELFSKNIEQYLKEFKQVNDIENCELIYLHDPQIGEIKC